jgi:hypothetical protein
MLRLTYISVVISFLLETLATVIFDMHREGEGEGEKFWKKKTEFNQNSAIKCNIQRIMQL